MGIVAGFKFQVQAMIYKSYQDLSDAIRRNLWKIPQDVDIIVGIPRSGMIAALMVAELLGRRCASLDDFLDGNIMSCGDRQTLLGRGRPGKVLVIDDTVNTGAAIVRARKMLVTMTGPYDILFGCVFARGRDAKALVNIWMEDIYVPGERWYLYEWNIMHHHAHKTQAMMWDIDGVLCQDPPSERDTKAYEYYLEHAVPMVVPTTPIGAIVTYRLEKYRDITERWLKRHGIQYNDLIMFQADSREERNATSYPGRYKAHQYKKSDWATLFVESDREQAARICELSGKPVFCYGDGKMYLKCP